MPEDLIDHPCPYPEEIPYRLIQMYSYPREVEPDPFAGSGQTLKVAKWLDRAYVGYETIRQCVNLANKRVKQKLSIRPRQLLARFEKIDKDEPAGQTPDLDRAAKRLEPAIVVKQEQKHEGTLTASISVPSTLGGVSKDLEGQVN